MKKLLVRDLQPGMMAAEDIFAIDGQLIVSQKTVLTDSSIDKLNSFAIYSIRVEDETAPVQAAPAPAAGSDSYNERIKATPDFAEFRSNFEKNVDTLRIGMNRIVDLNSNMDAENLLSQTLSFIEKSKGASVNLMDMLLNMREIDDSTYAHCISVSMICNLLAGWLHMSQEDRVLATSCGLFADIGKTMIPEDILTKKSNLSKQEFEIVKKHTIDGYNILDKAGMSDEVKNAALMHHEKKDGSGYPYGFTGDKISHFAKLVTVADVYDAMTSPRPQRDPLCPFEVIAMLEAEGFEKYDVNIILTFLENISNSFIGQRVRLDDGTEGEVIFINRSSLSRPTIKCGDKFIDLSQSRDRKIVSII